MLKNKDLYHNGTLNYMSNIFKSKPSKEKYSKLLAMKFIIQSPYIQTIKRRENIRLKHNSTKACLKDIFINCLCAFVQNDQHVL